MPLLTTVKQAAGQITFVKTDEEYDLTTIGGRMKWGRDRLGLSQPQLAKKAGMKSAGTIGNIEAGQRKKPRDLLSIARVLRLNPEWLETGRGGRLADSPEQPSLWDESPLSEEQLRQLLTDLSDLPPGIAGGMVDQIHQAAQQARENHAHLKGREATRAKVSADAKAGAASRTTVTASLPLTPAPDPWNAKPNEREAAFYRKVEKAPKPSDNVPAKEKKP